MSKNVMSAKGFLHKASQKAGNSAEAFLKAHREWLVTGELASFTSPILAKLDAKEILPTPCLETIKACVLGHMLASDARKMEEKLEEGPKAGKSQKPYIGTVYTKDGVVATALNDKGEEKDLIQSFDHPQDCQRFLDRKLVNDASEGCYGVLQHTLSDYSEVIMRGDAFARVFVAKKSPFMHVNKVSGTLGNKMRVRGGQSHFSKG